jgi:hypothetical protein
LLYSGTVYYNASSDPRQEVLNVYNISNPRQPVLIDGYPLREGPLNFGAIGNMLYIGSIKADYRVLSNAPVYVLAPGGPAAFKGGAPIRIHWRSDLAYAGTGMMLELWNSRRRVAMLGYDWSASGENARISNLPLVPVGSDYRLRVRSTWNSQLWNQSEQPFTITGGVVQVMAPNGGESWKAGTRQNVWWKVNPQLAGGTVQIELWRAGKKVMRLGGAADADGESVNAVWIPPSVAAGTDYKIRVVSAYRADWWDESDKTILIKK